MAGDTNDAYGDNPSNDAICIITRNISTAVRRLNKRRRGSSRRQYAYGLFQDFCYHEMAERCVLGLRVEKVCT